MRGRERDGPVSGTASGPVSGPVDRTGTMLPALAGGGSVVLASLALSAVVAGLRWLGFVIVTVAVVVGAGMLLRRVRAPAVLVVAGQLGALLGLITAVFTRSGLLVVVPGPAALGELGTVLGSAIGQVRVGIAPVAVTPELLCLITVSLGVVAVAVDTLAVTIAAPAAAGLVLLCVFAVPASLADDMLPGWTFVLGVLGFVLLLTVDSGRRHRVWGTAAGSGQRGGRTPSAATVTVGALVVSLLAGTSITIIGTDGRIPGTGPRAEGSPGSSAIGLNPFTSLQGQLNAGNPVELFRVRGLPHRTYLRALTLSEFVAGEGWVQGPLDASRPAAGPLPLPTGVSDLPAGPTVRIRIEPINYVDNWLPTFGIPLALEGVGPQWRYDPTAMTAFTEQRQQAPTYTQLAVLPQPSGEELRADGPPAPAGYLAAEEVDPRVAELARQLTADAPSPFDATLAINQFFLEADNGFRYTLETNRGSSGDALVDFLFEERQGYCEQYASAMAIMLRTIGIASRVAVGFTAGTAVDGGRLITTEDAHAWVEAYFPGAGWVTFDPTPLADGRSVVPPYVAQELAPPEPLPPGPAQAAPVPAVPRAGPVVPAPLAGPAPEQPGPPIATLAAIGVLVLLVAALTPAGIRQWQRKRRLALVDRGGRPAADAAWHELLAESRDRGVRISGADTVRGAARRLVRAYAMDDDGQAGLRGLVTTLERAWYGPPEQQAGNDVSPAFRAVRQSIRRCAPIAWRERLWPRSVFVRRLGGRDESDR